MKRARNCLIFSLALTAVACGGSAGSVGDGTAVQASAGAHDVEDQRKYEFSKGHDTLKDLSTTSDIDGFKITQHGQFDYADIYVDTDNLLVYGAELSVRFRKAVTGSATTYKIQVKSEKQQAADVRVEVDDDAIADNKVKVNVDGKGDGDKKTMHEWLDPLFAMAKAGKVDVSSKEYRQGAEAIRQWLDTDGRDTPPVKKLKELLGAKDADKVKHLRPILIGDSNRTRFHIYADGQPSQNPVLNGIAPNQMSQAALAADGPFFLQPGHQKFVWLMEGSYDRSTFVPAEPPDEVKDRKQHATDATYVEQLEVENKYRPLDDGTVFMDAFEKALQKKLGGHTVVDSKYANAVDALYGKR